ncbi:MAG TPA: DoxX family protein, partial [Thermoanaerobaculia bacterium]|nr:DoxX family protein [Thermoanaerobaculia bacterium]
MKIAYWITTIIIGSETLAGGVVDLLHGRNMVVAGPSVADIVTHLVYPLYLLTILGLWKIAGAIVIFAPGLPRLKEWAYAGVVFELTGAAASWALHGDPLYEL